VDDDGIGPLVRGRGRRAGRTPEEVSLDRLLGHRYGELVEAVTEEESFVTRAMFGAVACYLHGRLALLLADGDPPWDGILVATGREHHDALRAELPSLRVHPILGKWLYLPADADAFDDDGRRLAALALADDPRVGVEPKPRRRGKSGGHVRRRRRP
jgi:hypothetical protein